MNARDLREILANVPDHYEVGIEFEIEEDLEIIPIEGKSDTRWDCSFALVCERRSLGWVKLA